MRPGRATRRLWRLAVQTAYRLLYGPLSGLYDTAAAISSGGDWQEWQRATLGYVRGPRVLEVACGPGHLLSALAAQGHQPVGLDRSPQMARRAARRSGARLVMADARRLPFADGVFHSAVMTFSGLTTDTEALAEVRRVLMPGGRLVALDEVALRGRDWRTHVARGILGATSAGVRWPAAERMREAGFDLVVCEEMVGPNAARVLVGSAG